MESATVEETSEGLETQKIDARSDEEKASDKAAEDAVNGKKAKKVKEPKAKKESAGRAPSTMPGRRAQFRFAAEAVKASSILAATWLEKPAAEGGDGLVLGLFYYRTPDKGEKHKVFQVRRKDGAVTVRLVGEGADSVETYRKHYSPLLKTVRQQQQDAVIKAKADKKAARARAAKSEPKKEAKKEAAGAPA